MTFRRAVEETHMFACLHWEIIKSTRHCVYFISFVVEGYVLNFPICHFVIQKATFLMIFLIQTNNRNVFLSFFELLQPSLWNSLYSSILCGWYMRLLKTENLELFMGDWGALDTGHSGSTTGIYYIFKFNLDYKKYCNSLNIEDPSYWRLFGLNNKWFIVLYCVL